MSGRSEQSWQTELRDWVACYVGGFDSVQDHAMGSLQPHIDAAYERGLIAGRSQAGYATRRKPKEETCPTSTSAPGATGSGASAGEP